MWFLQVSVSNNEDWKKGILKGVKVSPLYIILSGNGKGTLARAQLVPASPLIERDAGA